jgi:rod shape-determining protein MreC
MNSFKNASLNKKKRGLIGFIAGAAIFVLILFALNFFGAEIKNFFMSVSSPIEKAIWQAASPMSNYLSSVSKFGQLENENMKLQEENQKLLSQIVSLQAALKAAEAENIARAFFLENNFNFVMAELIGFDRADQITLNKGMADGIFDGMPVVNEQGALYGRIITAYKNFSYVQLISSQSSIVSARVLKEAEEESDGSAIDGVVKGKGGLEVFLDLVPIDDQLQQGEILVSSALDNIFPKGLLVGRVENIQKNDQHPHQQAEVTPFFNISVDNLFIITNYKRSE